MKPYWLGPTLLAVYVVASPYYVQRSGNAQPADFVLLVFLLSGFHLLPYRTKSITFYIGKPALFFAWYASIVSTFWSLYFSDFQVLRPALYYTFNALVFVLFLAYIEQNWKKTKMVLAWGTSASIILLTLLSPLFASDITWRQTLSFNNPNQLGYYAIVCLSIHILSSKDIGLPAPVAILTTLCASYLASLSLSSGAMLGLLLLAIPAVVFRHKELLVAFAIALSLVLAGTATTIVEDPLTRIERIGDHEDDSLVGRRYDRIVSDPIHLLLGAGEWTDNHHGFERTGEMHSTWGTIAFSYGLPGAVAFIVLFGRIIRSGTPPARLLYLAPAAFYGLTHQGLRSTLFWMLIAVVPVIDEAKRSPNVVQNRNTRWRP